MTRSLFAGLLGALASATLHADDFPVSTNLVGPADHALITPANQIVTPAGTTIELPGMRPQAVALSPDGQTLVTSGLTHELVVVDMATAKIRQRVPLPAQNASAHALVEAILDADSKAQQSYAGLTYSPDGTRLYLSDINGDIKVFGVGKEKQITPLGTFPLPAFQQGKRNVDLPTGIAISADGRKLYVAANLSNRLYELETATGKVLRTWDVGFAPLEVVLARNKVYVSNWGGRRPTAGVPTGPGGLGTLVRVDARGIASEGSVSIIHLSDAAVSATPHEIVLGAHTCALAVTPNGKYLAAASAGTDLISIIDTASDEVIETITARQTPGDPFGAQPVALTFDPRGKVLYCANATQNAVAVFQFSPRNTVLQGLIPTGWFPCSLAYDARSKRILVANLKHIIGTQQPAKRGAVGLGYNTHQYDGSLSLIPVPDRKELKKDTATALANLRYPLLAQAKLPPRLNRPAVPVPERAGEPSVFKHVVYIIKENRTYDQVLGDIPAGNGNPGLCIFGTNTTPNQHRLVSQFTLLDNTYCCGILSADGHNWTDSGLASDYLERSFAGWVRSYPAGGFGLEGADALAYAPSGFIWDLALAHGLSVRNYGEFGTSSKHWVNPTRKDKIHFAEAWNDFTQGSQAIAYRCEPDIEPLRAFMEPDWPSWDLEVPDVIRAARYKACLQDNIAKQNLPALTVLWLPNDHTEGTKPGAPTPSAFVADNDLAVGQVVEAISHSPFWKDTCIFIIEDDPQDGWDHVSGYRTTAYVV
ncbi:MAG TPA: beta-propeller fold lactonase family protein, partial [Verrucomicrobiae bacterium]